METEFRSAINLRYLLWRRKVDKRDWAAQLAAWAGCDLQRAEVILRGTRLTTDELSHLAESTGISEEDLQYQDLLSKVDILKENLAYLIGGPPRGKKKELAEYLQVRPGTLSRWLSGKQRPTPKYLRQIQAYFGIPSELDLTTRPLFLCLSPVGEVKQREWLHHQINQLDAKILQEIFPALERLFREP